LGRERGARFGIGRPITLRIGAKGTEGRRRLVKHDGNNNEKHARGDQISGGNNSLRGLGWSRNVTRNHGPGANVELACGRGNSREKTVKGEDVLSRHRSGRFNNLVAKDKTSQAKKRKETTDGIQWRNQTDSYRVIFPGSRPTKDGEGSKTKNMTRGGHRPECNTAIEGRRGRKPGIR